MLSAAETQPEISSTTAVCRDALSASSCAPGDVVGAAVDCSRRFGNLAEHSAEDSAYITERVFYRREIAYVVKV